MNKYFSLILFLVLLLFFSTLAETGSKTVLVTRLDGPVTQATVQLVEESIEHAESINAEVLILTIDTPGGGLEETHKIVEMVQQSSVPVVGYVYPRGATAWSAGVFSLLSTSVAAMENHTVMGSCQPVEVTPAGSRLINDSKYINALKEWIKEIADSNGRNTSLVEEFVTKNLNLNASSALKFGVVDVVAPNVRVLLSEINGSYVDGKTLFTVDARVVYYSPSVRFHILSVVSDPTVYSILLILSIFSIIFGIHTPGHGAEVFGVIALILALLGMGFSLPYVSIIFLVIGFLLVLIEVFVTPGFGFIGIGGIISILLGAVFLVPSYSNMRWLITSEYQGILIVVAVVPTLLIAAFFLFALYKVMRIRKKKPVLNVFEGEEAETLDEITPSKIGYVRYRGEYWLAKSSGKKISARRKVVIERKEGSVLIVSEKKESKD
ncbi:MAG TPA: nodulation protein NfeD [Thermoplasmatales archaeon]|nr:nodulation protein NfeD [Thermoplasmatales archaeon]